MPESRPRDRDRAIPDDVGQRVVFGDKQYHLALCHTFRKVHLRCKSLSSYSLHLAPPFAFYANRSCARCAVAVVFVLFFTSFSSGFSLSPEMKCTQRTDIEILANFMGLAFNFISMAAHISGCFNWHNIAMYRVLCAHTQWHYTVALFSLRLWCTKAALAALANYRHTKDIANYLFAVVAFRCRSSHSA